MLFSTSVVQEVKVYLQVVEKPTQQFSLKSSDSTLNCARTILELVYSKL